MTRDMLDYVSGSTTIPEKDFGISPSSLSRFFSEIHNWYRTEVLGEEGFTGSTASYLGTLIHGIAESFTKLGTVDKGTIYKYLYDNLVSDEEKAKHGTTLNFEKHEECEDFLREHADHSDIDINVILDQYKPMGNALIEYFKRVGLPNRSEELIKAEVLPGYWACGSADAVFGTRLVDYKTCSDLTPKNYIPYNYKLQLLTYAWIYKQLGVNINTISIVWITRNNVGRVSEKTGKPMKDYPSQVVEINQSITNEDFDFIESLLKLVAETVQASKDYQQLSHVIWKDYRLKPEAATTPTLFKD